MAAKVRDGEGEDHVGDVDDFEEAGEPDMVATMEEVETHDEGPTKGADGE